MSHVVGGAEIEIPIWIKGGSKMHPSKGARLRTLGGNMYILTAISALQRWTGSRIWTQNADSRSWWTRSSVDELTLPSKWNSWWSREARASVGARGTQRCVMSYEEGSRLRGRSLCSEMKLLSVECLKASTKFSKGRQRRKSCDSSNEHHIFRT